VYIYHIYIDKQNIIDGCGTDVLQRTTVQPRRYQRYCTSRPFVGYRRINLGMHAAEGAAVVEPFLDSMT
jgi:hypothetical protein